MKTVKAFACSYGRSALSAMLTLYMTGNTDPSDLAKAGIAALLPPLLRWLNPKDQAFGRTTSQP